MSYTKITQPSGEPLAKGSILKELITEVAKEVIQEETDEEQEICQTCHKFIDHDDDDKKCGEGCPEYDAGWKEHHDEMMEEKDMKIEELTKEVALAFQEKDRKIEELTMELAKRSVESALAFQEKDSKIERLETKLLLAEKVTHNCLYQYIQQEHLDPDFNMSKDQFYDFVHNYQFDFAAECSQVAEEMFQNYQDDNDYEEISDEEEE